MTDPINELVLREFQAYFPPEEVDVRVGPNNLDSGDDEGVAMPLFYIPSRRVMQRLDNVVGPMNWQVKYNQPVNRSEDFKAGVEAMIGIRDLNGEWIWKGDVSQNTSTEAMKGGYSKSIVRAGVHWGISRYLYFMGDVADSWEEVERKYGQVQFKDKPEVPMEFRPVQDDNQTRFSQKQIRALRKAAMEAMSSGDVQRSDISDVWDEDKSYADLKSDIEGLAN